MVNYFDEIKTAENFAEEFFDEAEVLIQSALMKDNKDDYLRKVLKLVKEYRQKILGE